MHEPCSSFLLFIKLPFIDFFKPKCLNRIVLSLMHSLHFLVAALFINESGVPVNRMSSFTLVRHQVATSFFSSNWMSWQWDHRCLDIVELWTLSMTLSSTGWKMMCLAWTRRGRSDLGLPTGVPNAWRKALVRDGSGEGAWLAFEVGHFYFGDSHFPEIRNKTQI